MSSQKGSSCKSLSEVAQPLARMYITKIVCFSVCWSFKPILVTSLAKKKKKKRKKKKINKKK